MGKPVGFRRGTATVMLFGLLVPPMTSQRTSLMGFIQPSADYGLWMPKNENKHTPAS